MNHKIANIIKTQIKDLEWVDKIAGLTQTAQLTVTEGEKRVIKRMPISCDVNLEACTESDYEELIPNSIYKSIIYFEDGSLQLSKTTGNRRYFTSRLRLVCWLNYKMIEGGCGLSGDYVIDIIKMLPPVAFSVGDMRNIQVEVVSQARRDADIFGKYTYNELRSQYLMRPYDYFALDLEVKFFIITECTTFNGAEEECL